MTGHLIQLEVCQGELFFVSFSVCFRLFKNALGKISKNIFIEIFRKLKLDKELVERETKLRLAARTRTHIFSFLFTVIIVSLSLYVSFS